MSAMKIFGIAGWKNSGKTGLMVRLVSELTQRGYVVSTVKHAHHDFDIDKVGADSYRHREAGAHEVTIVSGTRFAIMHELRGAPEPSFGDILARLAPCDLVLIEAGDDGLPQQQDRHQHHQRRPALHGARDLHGGSATPVACRCAPMCPRSSCTMSVKRGV